MSREMDRAGGTNDTSDISFYLNLAAQHTLLKRREEYALGRTLARSKKGLTTFLAKLPGCCQLEISRSLNGTEKVGASTSTAVFSNVCDAIARHMRIPHSKRAKHIALVVWRCHARLRESFDHLMLHNLRLVVAFAKKAAFGYKLPLMDMIQEGNTGLMKGIDRSDYRRRNKLSTYVSWWIRQAMSRANAYTSRIIRLPPYKRTQLSKLIRFLDRYWAEHGSSPPKKKMMQAAGLKTEEALDTLLKHTGDAVSLESNRTNGDERTLGELVADPNTEGPEDFLERKSYRRAAREVLALLSPRERQVLRLRFGLTDGTEYTLEQIGHMPEFKFTRERTRQIEADALRRARVRARKHKVKLPSRFGEQK